MLETFFPKRCSRLRLLPGSGGGALTIMMCFFLGSVFGGWVGGSGGMLSN